MRAGPRRDRLGLNLGDAWGRRHGFDHGRLDLGPGLRRAPTTPLAAAGPSLPFELGVSIRVGVDLREHQSSHEVRLHLKSPGSAPSLPCQCVFLGRARSAGGDTPIGQPQDPVR
jgi:hypothetical protein